MGKVPASALARTPDELMASFERASAGGVGFADWMRQETMSDFDAARVLPVQGWVISETEFLLFAHFGAST
jgi:hypothetical protein